MEPEIIAHGFVMSEATHQLCYTRLIADCDSSVLYRIWSLVDYSVMKDDCVNHVTRNYHGHLLDLKKKFPNGLKCPKML